MGDGSLISVKRNRFTKKTFALLLMVLPAVVLLFVFNYLPMYGIIVAFKDFEPYRGFIKSPWTSMHGFKHFVTFLTDETFWKVLKNTIVISVSDIVFGFTAPILFALLANEITNKHFKKTVQTISYLPHFLSYVVVGGIFTQILSPDGGIVNIILQNVFGVEPVYFLTRKEMFVPIAVIVDIWKSTGFSAILYFATIAGIDSSLYEAAQIDGAGRLRQTIHVTIPGMIPIIVLMFLLRLSGIFVVGFDRIYNLQNTMNYETSEVISTYVFHRGVEQSQYSLTTAVGLVQSLLGFILLLVGNKISSKYAKLGIY